MNVAGAWNSRFLQHLAKCCKQVSRRRPELGFAMRMLGTFSKNIIPNGGLMVIYHGRIHKKVTLHKSAWNMPFFALSRFELSWHVDMSFLGGPKKHRFQELRTFFSRPTTSEICKPTVYQAKNRLKSWGIITTWWFQPHLKNMLVKLDHFPRKG